MSSLDDEIDRAHDIINGEIDSTVPEWDAFDALLDVCKSLAKELDALKAKVEQQ